MMAPMEADAPRTRKRVQMAKWIALTAVLVGLPFLGAAASGHDVAEYLEFPPKLVGVVPNENAPFSWAAFALYAAFIAVFVVPLGMRLLRTGPAAAASPGRFPWGGWAGVARGAASWTLAWNRFAWFEPWQKETFVLLWAAYMLVFNGLAQKRLGAAPMLSSVRRYAFLFAASAAYWWSFEYLNRFARNWRYRDIDAFGPFQYALAATAAFSTVLPAFFATYEWIVNAPRIQAAFREWIVIRIPQPRTASIAALVFSAAGLAFLGVWPDLLFPMVWVSPVLVFVSIQTLRGRPHVLTGIERGDWRRAVAASLAALCCGLFWEMWNWKSLAKWEYDIPFVGRFHLFEMPLLGYAGYIPFGLMCSAVADAVMRPRAASPAIASAATASAAASSARPLGTSFSDR